MDKSRTAGNATVIVSRQDGITAQATVQIEPFRPGIFSANATGTGVAAAVATRVALDSTQTTVPLFQCGATAGSCVPVPILLGAETDQIILLLFGTGIRFRSGLSTVQVTIGGQPARVLYAGAQGQFVGLDQLNVRIPRTLMGRGPVNVLVSVGGRTANAVTIDVR